MKIHLPAVGPDLPVHPFTGLTAIGLRRNGDPIWPVKGGSEDADAGDAGDGDGADDGDGDGQDGDEPLGPAGMKALEAEKDKRRKAQSALRPWSALARELGVKSPEEVKALLAGKTGDGDGQDVDKVRREALAEATRQANDRIIRSEVKAAAAGKLADPADAIRLLDLTQFEVGDDGEVDEDAITEAIDDLVKKKPYLAAQGGRRFQGSGDGGHRGDGKPKLQPGLGRLQFAYAQSTKTRS